LGQTLQRDLHSVESRYLPVNISNFGFRAMANFDPVRPGFQAQRQKFMNLMEREAEFLSAFD